MSKVTIVLLVILAILIIACIVLYFLGKKAEKKQAEQQEQLDAVKQTVSMLIIDKGRVRLRDAGFRQSLSRTHRSIFDAQKCRLSKQKSDQRL